MPCTRLRLGVGALALVVSGCREGVRGPASGPGRTVAADQFTTAIALRFGPIDRGPRFDAARPRLARAALVPSRVFDEPGLWTAGEGEWRQLDSFGRRNGEAYRLEVQPSAPPPRDPGDYRARLRLERVEDGRYEWTMRQELAVGCLRPEEAAEAVTALFRSAEGVSVAEALARAAQAFPRAAAAFSRLFHLETLELLPENGGATAVRLAIRAKPDRIRETAPRYATFLEKVAEPMRASATASDTSDATWWRLELAELLWTLRFRVRDGSLVPLEGSSERRLPDQLRVRIDFSTKAGLFTIGVRGLVADVTLTRTPHEKGYTARYRQAPDWRLPFLVKPFLKKSLRFPFEGPGSFSTYALRGASDGPTELVRDYGIRVRESWIVKWMGGLGDSAVGEFREGAESESDRYWGECLHALRDDVMSLLNE